VLSRLVLNWTSEFRATRRNMLVFEGSDSAAPPANLYAALSLQNSRPFDIKSSITLVSNCISSVRTVDEGICGGVEMTRRIGRECR
jgi:hypothetical protein